MRLDLLPAVGKGYRRLLQIINMVDYMGIFTYKLQEEK